MPRVTQLGLAGLGARGQSDSKASVPPRDCLRAGTVRGRRPLCTHHPIVPETASCLGSRPPTFNPRAGEGGPLAGVQGRGRHRRWASPGVCSPAGPREQLRPGPSRWGHAESSFTAETCVPRPPLSLGLQPRASADCWNPPAAQALPWRCPVHSSALRPPPPGGPPSCHHRRRIFFLAVATFWHACFYRFVVRPAPSHNQNVP